MSAVHFAPLDWLILALFVILVVGVGYSAKLRDSSILQYLAAGRSLTLPVFVATLVSTWYGGVLGVGESVATYGIGTLLLFGAPYYLFAFVYAVFLSKRVRRGAELSLPERLQARWGRGTGLVGACVVLLLAVPAAQVYMVGVLLQGFTGWPMVTCVVVSGVIITGFLLKGGLLADVRIGMVAFVLMYVGFVALDGYCLIYHPIGSILPALRSQNLLRPSGGAGPIGVISFFILGAWTLVDPAFHQRAMSAATPEIGRRGVLVSILFWMLFDTLSTLAGLYALALMKAPPADLVAVFPAFGDQILPAGLKGLFFVGMLGTIVSAMASYTLVSGATVGREIIGRIRPGLPDDDLTRLSRIGLFVGCGGAIAVALFLRSVVEIWYLWSGILVGALLIPVWLAYRSERASRVSGWVVSLAIGGGFLASFAWLAYGKRTHNEDLSVSWLGETFSLGTLVPALAVSAAILGVAALLPKRATGETQ